MERDMIQQSLEWLYRELKRARIAQGHAEERHAKLGENSGCLECELRNIRQKIEILDYLAVLVEQDMVERDMVERDMVERDMVEESNKKDTPAASHHEFLMKRFNMPERGGSDD